MRRITAPIGPVEIVEGEILEPNGGQVRIRVAACAACHRVAQERLEVDDPQAADWFAGYAVVHLLNARARYD